MHHAHKGRTGLERLAYASINSMHGLAAAVRHESAFRQELLVAAVLLPAALWLGANWIERSLLAGTVLLVLVVELLNSGIEAVVDRVSLEFHELSKRAKDYGSAAVLISLLLCAMVWGAALWARLA
jgi:diacylglycerol kinase (ATP)